MILLCEGLLYMMAEMMVYAFAGVIELGVYACLLPPEKRAVRPVREDEPESLLSKVWGRTAMTCAVGGIVAVIVTSVWSSVTSR